jgi:hypothetical protein
MKSVILSIIFVLLFWGCGSNSEQDSKLGDIVYGRFIDAPVYGLNYKTDSEDNSTIEFSSTNQFGEFKYKDGETIDFYIGRSKLGSVVAKEIITPYDLAEYNITKATNIARVLQSIGGGALASTLDLKYTSESDFGVEDISLENDDDVIEFVAKVEEAFDVYEIVDANTAKLNMDK